MKKGFTLVELLIVVVIIVTLMAITFRLAGVASDSSARNVTINRMQRLENALNGYYAAFGSYPPVATYAKRNVYLRVNTADGNQDSSETGQLEWESVRAVCQAQPLAARFPFDPALQPYVDAVSRIVAQRANSSDSRWKDYRARQQVLGGGFTAICNPNQFSGWNQYSSWQDVKIFQFGVMSFLLPRYMFMLKGLGNNLNELKDCAQWTGNNRLAAHPNNGVQFNNWEEQLNRRKSLLRRIPSQAVCARWMPNFEGIVACGYQTGDPKNFFGVKIVDEYFGAGGINAEDPNMEVFHNGSTRYVLDTVTVYDGWHQEFYYYSPPPFQSYRLWSGGPNGKSFPPWIPLETLKSETDKKTAAAWMADDVMYMSN